MALSRIAAISCDQPTQVSHLCTHVTTGACSRGQHPRPSCPPALSRNPWASCPCLPSLLLFSASKVVHPFETGRSCFSKSRFGSEESLSIQDTEVAFLRLAAHLASVLLWKRKPSCLLVLEIRLYSNTINNLENVSATTTESIKLIRGCLDQLPFKRFLLRKESRVYNFSPQKSF